MFSLCFMPYHTVVVADVVVRVVPSSTNKIMVKVLRIRGEQQQRDREIGVKVRTFYPCYDIMG